MCKKWLWQDKEIAALIKGEKQQLKLLFKECNSLFDKNAVSNSERITLLYNDEYQIIAYCAYSFCSNEHTFLETYDNLFHPINIDNCIYIHQVFVKDDYRNKGCGKYLYEKLALDCQNKYIKGLYAHVATTNIESKYFHSSLKFTCVGEYKRSNFYGYADYHSLLMHLPVGNFERICI